MQLLHACPARALRSGSPSNVLHFTSRSDGYASLHEGEVCTLVPFHLDSYYGTPHLSLKPNAISSNFCSNGSNFCSNVCSNGSNFCSNICLNSSNFCSNICCSNDSNLYSNRSNELNTTTPLYSPPLFPPSQPHPLLRKEAGLDGVVHCSVCAVLCENRREEVSFELARLKNETDFGGLTATFWCGNLMVRYFSHPEQTLIASTSSYLQLQGCQLGIGVPSSTDHLN